MKKSIFELTRKEGLELDKEFKRTSYYKQYVIIYMMSCIAIGGFAGMGLGFINKPMSNEGCAIILALGLFTFVICYLLFGFKKFDLIKKYYDEKNAK